MPPEGALSHRPRARLLRCSRPCWYAALQSLTWHATCNGSAAAAPPRSVSGSSTRRGCARSWPHRLVRLPRDIDHRLRLQLDFDGGISCSAAGALPETPLRVRLAERPIGSELPLLRHKGHLRGRYDTELALAEAQGHSTRCASMRAASLPRRTQQRLRETRRGMVHATAYRRGCCRASCAVSCSKIRRWRPTSEQFRSICSTRPKRSSSATHCAACERAVGTGLKLAPHQRQGPAGPLIRSAPSFFAPGLPPPAAGFP